LLLYLGRYFREPLLPLHGYMGVVEYIVICVAVFRKLPFMASNSTDSIFTEVLSTYLY
jgi:hypothetical protein